MTTPENNTYPTKEALKTNLNFSQKTLSDFEVISVIGRGTFGNYFKVRDKENGQVYAWKEIQNLKLNEVFKKFLDAEIKVLQQLQHPHLVRYFHHLVNYESRSIFVIMEYCEGGDLAQLIAKAEIENKRFEERYIWRVLFQICNALCMCYKKSKQSILLQLDIRPANIFLDTKGNAKLVDFGLSRLLRRGEESIGTSHDTSTEIIKSSKYDKKSNVWAVGCLIYEMCCLRPPFSGTEYEQLPTIPDIYSADLQEIIKYTFEPKSDQNACIQLLCHHPLLQENINQSDNDFPVLVDIELPPQDFSADTRKWEYSPLQSLSRTNFKEQNSFNEEYGQRLLSITGIFTPDLKSELFYSARRKIFPMNSKLQLSDPELYESIRCSDEESLKPQASERLATRFKNISKPYEVTQQVFNSILQERLKAIKAQESLLKLREEDLNVREQQLIEKEKRLIAFEQRLASESKNLDILGLQNCTNERLLMTMSNEKQKASNVLPAAAPEAPTKHDDTYCTIEPNDISLSQQPTMAKLNMASLPALKVFPTLRKVTFQSPKKIFTYQMQSKKQKTVLLDSSNRNQIHSSTCSKISEHSNESAAASSTSSTSTTKRKSILSIFGLHRSNKEIKNISPSSVNVKTGGAATATKENAKEQKGQPLHKQEEHIISKCETAELNNIWTTEHKKAAFEMLAAMNAAKSSNYSNSQRHKMRQSIRGRNTLQRSGTRRSLVVPASISNSHERDQIFI